MALGNRRACPFDVCEGKIAVLLHRRRSHNRNDPTTQQRKASRAKARRPYLLTIVALAALPVIAEALIWTVQTRFERTRLDGGREIAGFIALGGGQERIAEAMALARSHPKAKLVITGEGEATLHPVIGTERGDQRLLIEDKAKNTYENAVFTARLINPKAKERWVLVTSASHMPRAIGCFRRAGFSIEAWPVPDAANNWIDYLSRATHEWGGLLAYWVQGRTDSLFPSPLWVMPQATYDRHSSGAPSRSSLAELR